jgi:molecular chaperone GrpE
MGNPSIQGGFMQGKEPAVDVASAASTSETKAAQDSVDEFADHHVILGEGQQIVATAYLEDLQQRLQQAESLAESLQLRYRQAQGQLERENAELRKRWQRNAEEQLEKTKGSFYQRLLEVIDNLERALQLVSKGVDPAQLVEGVQATHTILLRLLAQEGVQPITAQGTNFDPQLHEAVDMIAVEADRDGQVTAVYQVGYQFAGKLLRPAMVQVGKTA